MRIGITGGAGFIGQATAQWAQREGHEVVIFDHTEGFNVLGPLRSLSRVDAVIHLAGVLGTAELFGMVERAIDVNVKGAARILQWCADHDIAYVGITMPPVFPSVYTATKLCADRLATAFHLATGQPVSRVRAFNAYGAGQKHGRNHPQKIVPTFATKAWNHEPIPVWGDGSQTVDLVHVDDVGRMLVDATRHGDDAVFDAGTGNPLTVQDVADFVLDRTGSTGGIEYLPMRIGETPTHISAQGDGWDRLTWTPKFSWERLAEVVDWYRP